MAERAYPEAPEYTERTKHYYSFIKRYGFGKKYTKNKIVLDVPCGSGWGMSLIDNTAKIYGLDYSSDALTYGKEHFKGVYIRAVMDALPFRKDTFDIALCFEGLEHISKDQGQAFLREIKSVVKKDCLIVGSVPILDRRGRDTGNPFHKFEYPEDYLKKTLQASFKVLKYIRKKGADGPLVYFVLKNVK